MLKKTSIAAAIAATSLFVIAGQAVGEAPTKGAATTSEAAKVKRPEPLKKQMPAKGSAPAQMLIMDSKGIRMAPADVSAHALAEYLILESAGFDLEQPTQEGTTGRDRLVQDEIQKLCSLGPGESLDPKVATKVAELAQASINSA